MITNYIPNTCGYGLNNLKKVVHIFSESANVIHIDNGEAYVASGITDLQTISATSVSFEETTAYDDRFKFQKTVTATVNGFSKLSALGGKYYIVLEDVNGIMWLVNTDFPSLVTYTYTLQDGTDETVFTFSALSNFPTLKLNASINNAYACQNYSLVRVDEIKMLEKRYANIYTGNSVVYGYSNQVYKTVRPYRNSIKVEETFDGTDANTTIQFSIGLDVYQSSWHYNMLEYPYNKYVAVIDHLACGFEMGLVPSYNVQGSHQIGGGDTVTVTLVGGSQRGSEWANSWLEVTIPPQYTWRLTDEWMCRYIRYRWTESGTTCIGYDKYQNNIKEKSIDEGRTWSPVNPPEYSASTLIEADSPDCGWVFDGKYRLILNDSSVVTGACDETSAVTSGEVATQYSGSVVSAEIGNCVTDIKGSAFRQCHSLTSVTISNNVENINYKAFYGCENLTSCEIGSGVSYLGSGVFFGCTSLTGVTIPSGVTTLRSDTFYSCDNLAYVSLPSDLTSIGNNAFNGCGFRAISLPSGLTSIGDSAFYCCERLSGITIPDSVTSISTYAFQGCSRLTKLKIGTGLTTIASATFSGCTSLIHLEIPDNITRIGNKAFNGCTYLQHVEIGSGVTAIGENAFGGCSRLNNLDIPDNTTTIEGGAFSGCTSLTGVTIGSGVTSIGSYAFSGCSSLTGITINAITPPTLGSTVFNNTNNCPIYVPCESVEAYYTSSNWGGYADRIEGIPPCVPVLTPKYTLTLNDSSTVSAGCDSTSAMTVPWEYRSLVVSAVIGDCVTSIGNSAFYTCTGLTSITIASTVTEIGYYAFSGCTGLGSVTIPNNVTYIGQQAFIYCSGLTSVTIGSSIRHIDIDAFAGCSGLTSMTIYATTPPKLGNYTSPFNNTNRCPFYVPAASVDAYKSARVWSSFKSRIYAIPGS